MTQYLIQDSTLTNIADAIREQRGITDLISPEAMPSQIRAIQTISTDKSNIPEYVIEEANRVANQVLNRGISNKLTFIAVSDMHEAAGADTTESNINNISTANKHAGYAAKLIADLINPDFFVALGDMAFGSSTTTMYDGLTSILNAKSYFKDVIDSNVSFLTPGNHDPLTYSYPVNQDYLSYDMLCALIGTYQYRDFESQKVRVICLNTADNNGSNITYSTGIERISGEQLQWFANTLDLSSKSNADEWGIIILSHHPLDWGSINPAAKCLVAYLNGTSYSATHEGVSVSYNYAGKNSATVIAQFHGHVHGFRADHIYNLTTGEQTNIWRLAIPNSCFTRNNEYGENGKTDSNNIEFGEPESYEKILNCKDDTAFCVVTIDLDSKNIYADCYGKGYDRAVNYGSGEVVVKYNITINASNASSTNTKTSIEEGATYSTIITANNGYELSGVTVLMGSADITSTAYNANSGAISVNSVTGDLIITITTTQSESGDSGDTDIGTSNLYLIAEDMTSTAIYNNGLGYKDNVYVSSSASAESYFEGSASGYTATGWIPYVVPSTGLPPKIQISGAAFSDADDHCRIFFFDETKQKYAIPYLLGDSENENNQFTKFYNITDHGNQTYTLDPIPKDDGDWMAIGLGNDSTQAAVDDIRYFRLSIAGEGKNLSVVCTPSSESEEETYAITNNLTNITNNNVDTSIKGGESYFATLAADEGYVVESVVITMGGNDVSSSYSNGEVYIESVIGDIVITASAVVNSSGDSGSSLRHSVTTQLNYIHQDNQSVSVEDGASYEVNLTPMDGYTIKSVIVTMDGVDISSSYNGGVSGGLVSISSVTGDIVITGTTYIDASGEPLFTNLVPTSEDQNSTAVYNDPYGYKNDTRVSTSSTTGEESKNGYVTTGWIPYLWDTTQTLYVKGATIDTTDGDVRFYGWKDKYTMSSNGYVTGDRISTGTYFAFEELSDNYYKLTPAVARSEINYLKVSLIGSGENLIITVNEPIE